MPTYSNGAGRALSVSLRLEGNPAGAGITIDEVRKEQRRRFRTIRKELGEEGRPAEGAAITERLLAHPEWDRPEVIHAYLDFVPEIATRDATRAVWDAGKVVALPWCVPGTHEMLWLRVTSFENLVRNPIGVEEPEPLAKFDGI